MKHIEIAFSIVLMAVLAVGCTKEEVAERVQKYQSFEKRIESYKEWIETFRQQLTNQG